MTIEELFGTLQQATVASWRKHLRTAKYAKHEALDEFYKELPEMVDALIEGYMGAHGKKITKFENILKSSNMNTLKYLQELKKVCKQGYGLLDENEELKGLLDDIVNLINSTLYKVKELAESSVIDLKDYLNEALVNEARTPSLSAKMKKDIDSYLNGMDKYDITRLRDNWKEGNDVYNNMMFNMDMYLFGGVPGKFDPYKQLTSDYIYSKILDRVGVNESNEYPYDEKKFNPKDCLTWLLKTRLLDKFNNKYDVEEWAEMAQTAAEDAGVPLKDAERVYDAACEVQQI